MRPARVLAVAALAGALAGATAGCTASDGGTAQGPESASATTAAPKPTPLPSITARADDATEQPAPSSDGLAGNTASEQKQYATINAAAGTFDGAVLEAGQAVCDKVAYTAQIDQGKLDSALSGGELANATSAIPLLCPDYTPQLVEALHGFDDGTFAIGAFSAGSAVPSGSYVAATPSATCTWKVVDSDGTTLVHGKASAKTVTAGKPVKVTIAADAVSVTSSGCRSWLPK